MKIQAALGRDRVSDRIELVDGVACVALEQKQARVAQLEGPVAAAHHGQRCVLERELLVQWGEHLNRVGVASGK